MPMVSPLGCGSPLYSTAMTFCKSLIILLIFCWPISLRTTSCQVLNALSWDFPTLLSFMSASLTLRFSHTAQACLMSSHVEPFYISFVSWFLFLSGGDFPPSVAILHMYPFIENRYVLLLGTSFVFPYDTRLLLVCNYKAILFFFKLFKYLKKSKKNKKTKKSRQGNMLSLAAVESYHLQIEHCVSHPLVGFIVWI